MIKIIQAKTEEDCKICDTFLSNLINFESHFDNIIKSNAIVKDIHKKSLQNDYVYIAYAYDKKPIGYVFAYLKSPKGKVNTTNIINLEALYVDENYRQKGIGKKIVESVETWAKNNFNNDYAIEITTIKSNTNAVGFYKRLGYQEVKTILRK